MTDMPRLLHIYIDETNFLFINFICYKSFIYFRYTVLEKWTQLSKRKRTERVKVKEVVKSTRH